MQYRKHKFYFNRKEKLSDLEKEDYAKTIKSKIKRELFKQVINSDRLKLRRTKSRISAFEKAWKIATYIENKKYKGGSQSTKNRRTAELVKESVYSDTGIVNKFKENDNLPFEENLKNAEVDTYKDRTQTFFEKYGNKTDNKNKSLNDYLSDYENGYISKNQLNKIIVKFQKYYLAEYDSSVYKSRHRGKNG